MKIGVIGKKWWQDACAASEHEMVGLPMPLEGQNVDKHHADLQARANRGPESLRLLEEQPVSFLLDDAGSGLQFVPARESAGGEGDMQMVHERLGVPYVSHFVDPLPVCFGGLGPNVYYQVLMSNSWIKLISDKAHAYEMQQFGVPNIGHMPMASWDRAYDTAPLDPEAIENPVAFVGRQVGTYFYPERNVASHAQLPGVIAHAVRSTNSEMTFFDVYHHLYKLAAAPTPEDEAGMRLQKMINYFNAKLYFSAALWIAQRDRFILFLKKHLGDQFQVFGDNWDKAYGLPAHPPIASYDDYFGLFRKTLININCVSGNAETGLNMRSFEITAAGGFLLQNWMPELEENFEIGKECDTFRDEEELLKKCQYYMEHPERAFEIARAGQERTLREHLYSHRLARVIEMIERVRPEPVREGSLATSTQ